MSWIFLLNAFCASISLWTPSAHAQTEAKKTIVLIGDSLTEGYGVAQEQAFPALMENLAHKANLRWKVINAGLGGSTSASGPSRTRWQVKQKPDLIVLALGANDGLRGLSTDSLKRNLKESIAIAQASGTKVVLLGMQMPPNYGAQYRTAFAKAFADAAKETNTKFLPFLLDGVAGRREYNQPDGIHPNAEGHKQIAQIVFKFIKDIP